MGCGRQVRRWIVAASFMAASTVASVAHAGTFTTYGAVTSLDHVSQLGTPLGTADFDDGPMSGDVPPTQYPGLTFHTGPLSSILPGVTAPGGINLPCEYEPTTAYFPAPIGGGGQQNGIASARCMTMTFSDDVTLVGLTASYNAIMHITVWDRSANMIGQVVWDPDGLEASFIGIDTGGVPIGLLTIGNDDVWAGENYDISGSTIIYDTLMWAGTGGGGSSSTSSSSSSTSSSSTSSSSSSSGGTTTTGATTTSAMTTTGGMTTTGPDMSTTSAGGSGETSSGPGAGGTTTTGSGGATWDPPSGDGSDGGADGSGTDGDGDGPSGDGGTEETGGGGNGKVPAPSPFGDDSAGGCACRATGGGVRSLAALLVLGLVRRRRSAGRRAAR